jgi:hypothetical protein
MFRVAQTRWMKLHTAAEREGEERTAPHDIAVRSRKRKTLRRVPQLCRIAAAGLACGAK